MKILVTGSTGFLGRTLCERLKEAGHEVFEAHSKNCDLTRADSFSRWNDVRLDQIFHLAAWTQAGDFCLRHPGEQWIINQQINTHVLAGWHSEQNQAKLISIGTSCAYDPNLPLVEENYLKGEPIEGLFTYAMTKRMLYTGQMALAKQWGYRHLCAVPSTLYGPGYHTDGRQMHFIFDLIRKILRAKNSSEPVVLWGDGYQKRELVFVEDFVKALLQVNQEENIDLINLGAGREYSIREFAQAICDEVDYDFRQIQFDLSRYVGARSKCLDSSKLLRRFPDLEFTALDEGLKKTIRWFRSLDQFSDHLLTSCITK